MSFDNWAISEEMFLHIRDILPDNKTILEFGSGTGTYELLKHYNVISIEDNPKWLHLATRFNTNDTISRYIHAPLTDIEPIDGFEDTMWYDLNIMNEVTPTLEFDLVIIDGPCTGTHHWAAGCDIDGLIGRAGILSLIKENPEDFKDTIFMIDDCGRDNPHEKNLAERIASEVNGTLAFRGTDKIYAIILPE